MATVNVPAGKLSSGAQTMVSGEVLSVRFLDRVPPRVRIWTDGTADILYTTDGTTPDAQSLCIPAGAFGSLTAPVVGSGIGNTSSYIHLKSAGTPSVRVEVASIGAV